MFLIIKDNNRLIKQSISKYYKYKGITIYQDGDYFISLSNDYYFDDDTRFKKLNIQKYIVFTFNSATTIELYLYLDNEGMNDYYLYENSDFLCAKDSKADIYIDDNYLKDYYLSFYNKRLTTNYDALIINGHRYHDEILKNGDHVELLGISFYYYDDFICINNFQLTNRLVKKSIKEDVYIYHHPKLEITNYYEEPYKELTIDKLEVFDLPKRNNSRKLILQVGPTITMSLAMIMLAAINVYNNSSNNNSRLSVIALLLMPITMLISGIAWPLITSLSEKSSYKREYNHKKNEYLKYLEEYDIKAEETIKTYIKEENNYFFNINDIERKTFYISKNSKRFLDISLGYQKMSLDFQTPLSKDTEIDEYINRIKYRINNIENCPLFLKLNENKRITIIQKELNRINSIKRVLLELCYKYHYDDLYIAIYAKDIKAFNEVFNLPHLFYKEIRLTLISERELQDLNNLKLDRPLVVLMYDYSEYIWTNNNIRVIYFSNANTKILKNSDCVIEFNNNMGVYKGNNRINFKYYEQIINYEKYYNYLANYNYPNNLKKIITFKDVFQNIDIVNNYLNNKTSLKADFSTINDELLSFDLHESKDGPHGLIGGSTGSGKSELIISLLLSLAINYAPDYLNIILIDYKGGGIKESLSYNKKSIPHIIAAINNLETSTFERLIVAISRECKKRQRLFKELSDIASTSIMNIDDYLDINKKYKYENIAHLLIVVDEFAELKKENPYIIKELISFSRIGRSLGIHLILATQRPNGVIDDEIWSNSHFKIALKVHNEKDSQDIIKLKDAAYLNKAGEFFLRVDDNTIKAEAIYSKRDINNNDQFEVCLLDNKLNILKRKVYKKTSPFLEATYLSKLIIEATNKLNIVVNQFDYKKPEALKRSVLMRNYKCSNQLVLGEIDDYLNAQKGILAYSIDENILIYSNRNKEINNILSILKENKRQTIVISNSRYQGGYIVDSLLYEDEEDIKYLFNKIANDNDSFINIVIEDLGSLLSYDEDYTNQIYQLIRRSNVSNYKLIVLTKETNINFKLLNSIKNKVAININEQQDLINLFSTKGSYQGQAYYMKDIPITFVPCVIEEYCDNSVSDKTYIDRIPNDIRYEFTNGNLLIGYDLLIRKKIYINENDALLISSYDQEIINKYKTMFIKNINVKVALYCDDLIINNYKNIMWLGDGLYSQRLFYVEKDYSLTNKDAYLYRNNKGRTIRPINYE